GRRDTRCTVSIGGFVPKPHTPFQWAAQCAHETVDARLRALGAELRSDRAFAKAIGFRYHDGKPSVVEGLLSRGDRRVAKVILAAWQDGARFDGWSENFSFERWERCAASALADDGVDLAWYTTRERGYDETLPWDHLDAGLERDWLWQDWLAAIDPGAAEEGEDCRWAAAAAADGARCWRPGCGRSGCWRPGCGGFGCGGSGCGGSGWWRPGCGGF